MEPVCVLKLVQELHACQRIRFLPDLGLDLFDVLEHLPDLFVDHQFVLS